MTPGSAPVTTFFTGVSLIIDKLETSIYIVALKPHGQLVSWGKKGNSRIVISIKVIHIVVSCWI